MINDININLSARVANKTLYTNNFVRNKAAIDYSKQTF